MAPFPSERQILCRDDLPMDLAFFRDTLRMTTFNEEDLQEFQMVVDEYIKDIEFARYRIAATAHAHFAY